jgi:two-component system sensor histidine kinase AlgZ
MRKLSTIRLPIAFWPLQLLGWLGYGIATAISYLPFRHMRDQVVFRAVFFTCSFLASFAVHQMCRKLWRRKISLIPALALCVMASYIFGVLCTAPAIWAERRIGPSQGYFPWNSVLAGGVGAAFILIAWSALYFGFKQYRTVEEQRLALLTAESTARSAQLQALQYQLQPHFLFNTLNAISSLVVSDQPQQAAAMLASLGILLRSSLEAPEIHTLTLSDELVTVEEYLAIERARFGSRLIVSFDIDPQVDVARVPRFLLQPLIENAVRYGIATRSRGGEIALRASLSGEALRIEIENELPDPDSQNTPGSGLGLRNSRERLEQLYGRQSSLTTAVIHNNRFLTVVTFPFAPADLGLDVHQEGVPA